MRAAAWLLACACAVAGPISAATQDEPLHALRVCADPHNLPFSEEDGSGFENRLAKLVADEFGVPLEFAWLPDRRGFVRKTMGAGLCDVVMGVPAGFERTLNTRPYYRSSYVLVEAKRDPSPPASFFDPRLRRWRVGVQLIGDDFAATPPGHALAQAGATANVIGYPIPGDEPAVARIFQALARGELDAAFVWGPQAGYYAQRAARPMQLHYVAPPATLMEQPFSFAIAMGVKRGNKALRDRLDEFIVRRQPDIDRILADYGVPRTGEKAP